MLPFIIIGVIVGAVADGFVAAWVGGALGFFVWMLIDGQIQQAQRALQDKIQRLESELNDLKRSLEKAEATNHAAQIKIESEKPPLEAKLDAASSLPVLGGVHAPLAANEMPHATLQQDMAPVSAEVAVENSEAAEARHGETDTPTFANSLWQKLVNGNILAKIGAVLLFFGVASALKLAAEHGLFPIQLRLLLGALTAVGMIVFGYSRTEQPQYRMFGLAMQGGGFAILYLLVNFMLTRYGLIGHTAAFLVFAALGVGCTILAARQNGAALAVLGMAGAFLAPILASDGSGNYVALFSYFVLLNAFILSVNWFKSWRALNVTGFLMTFIIGMGWALRGYRPEHFANVEVFLVIFFLMYSLTPVLSALFKSPGLKGWQEGILVFGVPTGAAAIQHKLLAGNDMALAWWALAAGIYYLGLWWMLYRKSSDELRLMERSHLGIAIAFLTIAVPLAFGTQLTVALWALEGSAVAWLGSRQGRPLARYAGSALQGVAGLYFLAHLHTLSHRLVVLNDVFIGMAIVAYAGLFTARQLSGVKNEVGLSRLLLLWGGLWWLAAGLMEVERFVPEQYQDAAGLLFISGTAMVWELIGRIIAWPDLRRAAWVHFLAAMITPVYAWMHFPHVLHDLMALVFPLAVVAYGCLLYRQERDDLDRCDSPVHSVFYWLLVLLVGHEASWLADKLGHGNTLWPWLAWGVTLAIAVAGTIRLSRQLQWPFHAHGQLDVLLMPVALLAAVWSVIASISHAGGGSGLPYMPILSFYDIVQMLVIIALYRHSQFGNAQTSAFPALKFAAVLLPLFVWLSSMAARIAHHWGGVPFMADALRHSGMFQTTLSFIWTCIAIVTMLYAGKIGSRVWWYAGFSLLGMVCAKLLLVDLANAGTVAWTASLIGISVLVIAASYFSPIPPSREKKSSS